MNSEMQLLSPNEEILALALRNRSEDYTYGRRESYERQAKARFAGGTVTVLLSGVDWIQKIRIEGDFFGEGDIREVEKALENCDLCEKELSDRLSHLPIEHYISGVTAEELSELILAAR